MGKKLAGLGKGLDALMEDNTPTARHSTVVLRSGTERIHVTPEPTVSDRPKPLFEEKPRNRSVKSNFSRKDG
ncbi:MAG: hypothetical protein IJY42_06480 [Clostridia bacterium]|nr:hypothetical protein [Clostridia bacterium]